MQWVILINGSGGVGKDTVCALAGRVWRVRNLSSIAPILELARAAGWDGNKTPAARLFLSTLKQACTAFNDLPFRYCMEQVEAFRQSTDELLFLHVREPHELARLQRAIGASCRAMLVRRPAFEQARGALGNPSDDGVAQYPYDGVLDNDGSLDDLARKVEPFLRTLLTE